ncbi:MAG: hypothetical protein AAGI91_14060 [Bacteroidota bacterium]
MRPTHDSDTTHRPNRLTRGCALALLLSAALLGCDHATESAGPSLIVRFGEFDLQEPLSASQDMVDFAAGESVSFAARFNKPVNWIVEITGQESGAVRRIEGFSSELTEENARWIGGTTQLPLFREEAAEAALIIPDEESDTTRVTISVLTPRLYPGEVVTGFEDDEEAVTTLRNFEFELDAASGPSMEVPAAEGETFYLLRGTDTVVDNFFVGLAEITSPSDDGYFTVPTNVPENLFFNAFLYNFGSSNTIAILDVVVDANGNGTFEDGTDAIFGSGDIRLEEPGWSQFSLSVSEFGLTEAQTQQIVAVRLVLISDNNTQPDPREPVDFGVDYVTFTSGGPLRL